MKKQISYKIVSLVFSILVLCFAIAFYAVGWTEPSVSPPAGNVDAPLNVGDTTQYKSGALGVGGLFETDNETHLAILGGNVGIGTANPDATFQVNGTMKVLGVRENKTKNTPYEAATDGFVTAWLSDAIGDAAVSIAGFTDDSPDPITKVIMDEADRDNNIDWAGISFPVRKGDYWKVRIENGPEQDYNIYWVPFGN